LLKDVADVGEKCNIGFQLLLLLLLLLFEVVVLVVVHIKISTILLRGFLCVARIILFVAFRVLLNPFDFTSTQ
jgi:hypothetical protein